jgi:nucleotide-binding universal stress UspA family protein
MNAKKIVVGVNGSAASNAALEWAMREAAVSGAEVIAVHVMKPVGGHEPLSVTDVRLREFDYLGDDTRSRVKQELFEPLTASEINHRILIVEGHPAAGILHVADAEDAGLIVVGNGLHSNMEDLFLGSVAHELTHRATRPLAIVPMPHGDAIDATGRAQRGASAPRQTRSHRAGDHLDEVGAIDLQGVR